MAEMNVTRRNLFKMGGVAAMAAAGASMLGGCSAQPAASGASDASSSFANVPEFLKVPEPIVEFDETKEFDVVVVGAGLAGMSAAHASNEAGARTALCQKLSTVQTAGNMGACIDLEKTDEAGIQACISFINYKSDWRSNRDVVDVWARNGQEALAWWAETAAAAGFESKPYDYELSYNGYTFYLHANTYFHEEGGHAATAPAIGEALVAEGVEIFFNSPCVQLYKEGDAVTGVICENENGGHTLFKAAKGVILATGDYVGDQEMLYFYTPDARGLHQAVEFRDGSGLRAAMWAGAQMCPASHTKMVHGENAAVRFEMPFLFLNCHGERFMDEGCCRMGYLNEFTKGYLSEVDFADNTPAKIFSIVPSNWEDYVDPWDAILPYEVSTHNAYRNVNPEKWIKGETLEELATNIIAYADEQKWTHDLTVEKIVASIERYNEVVASGADSDFGKRADFLTPIEAPCYAAPRGGNNIDALVNCLDTDAHYQCLDIDRKPIAGLYAVGNASGNFFGSANYPMDIEGLSVGRAITTGFATGRYVAGL